MSKEIEFLRDAAEQLRGLAGSAPDIALQLHDLAAQIDAEADRLEGVARSE